MNSWSRGRSAASQALARCILPKYTLKVREDFEAILADLAGFEWDGGNTAKNVLGHGVTPAEAEAVFFNEPLVVLEDEKHSEKETRYLAHGTTVGGRLLTAAFTIRNRHLRIISVRDMSRKERRAYEAAR